MRHLFLTLAFLTFAISPALANHTQGHTENHKQILIEVNGLVCDFCARALEKVFYKQAGVDGVDVNLDTHIVTLETTDKADLSDETLKKLVTDSGYNLVNIKREK